MRFWHTVEDKDGNVKEQYLVSNSNRRMSLEMGAKIIGGIYKVIPQPDIN